MTETQKQKKPVNGFIYTADSGRVVMAIGMLTMAAFMGVKLTDMALAKPHTSLVDSWRDAAVASTAAPCYKAAAEKMLAQKTSVIDADGKGGFFIPAHSVSRADIELNSDFLVCAEGAKSKVNSQRLLENTDVSKYVPGQETTAFFTGVGLSILWSVWQFVAVRRKARAENNNHNGPDHTPS